jgi:CheY-like chemotaxis protein
MPDPVVLVVDDSADDLALVRLAFRKLALQIDLRTAEGGADALAYLKGTGAYQDRQLHPIPRLVLLDLKMPRVNGFDVLASIQSTNAWNGTVVIVLSTSQLPEEVQKATALGAMAFHTKPVDLLEFHSLLEKICSFFGFARRRPENQVNAGLPIAS